MIQSSSGAWLIFHPLSCRHLLLPSLVLPKMVTQLLSACIYTPTATDYLRSAPLLVTPGLSGLHSSGLPVTCSFLVSGASVPKSPGLLCVVASACSATPAASSIPVALLPRGCSYLVAPAASSLLLPHGSCLCEPSAAVRISRVQGFVSWFLCPSGLLLSCGFMASATLWPVLLWYK